MSSTYNPYNSPALERFSVGTRKPVVKGKNAPKAKQKFQHKAKVDTVDENGETPSSTAALPSVETPSSLAEDNKENIPKDEEGQDGILSPMSEEKSEDDSLQSPRPNTAKTDGRQTKVMRRQFQKPGRRDIPVSIENEHRYIISTLNSILTEIRKFKRSYRSDGCDFEKCIETANEILEILNIQEVDIEDPDQFRRVLASQKLDRVMRERPEVGDLENLCDKSTKFEGLMVDVQSKLSNCINNHLAKYCLSFVEECKQVHIECVHDYEKNIQTHLSTLKERLEAIAKASEEYNSLKSPFVQGYLKNGNHIMEVMDGCVHKVSEACSTMRRWTIADKSYPGKLWEGIQRDNKDKTKTVEDLKKMRQTKDGHLPTLHRKEIIRDKAGDKFTEAKIERKKLKTHKENLADRFSQSEKELEEKENSLKEVTHAYNTRKSNSPKLMDMLSDKMALYESEIAKIEERLGMLKRQRERYEKMDSELEDQIMEYEYDVMGKQGEVDSVKAMIRTCDVKINGFLRDLKTKDLKIAAAKTVRDMKLSPATLRKIYFQKMETSSQGKLFS